MAKTYNPQLTVPMLIRAKALRLECNLSYAAVARVLTMEYGRPVGQHAIRAQLRKRGAPADMRRVTDATGQNLQRGRVA